MPFISAKKFWPTFIVALLIFGVIFIWELGYLSEWIPSPPRPIPSRNEIIYTVVLTLLLSFDAGLFAVRRSRGSCPIGTKRVLGVSGALGMVTLLCPACLLIPLSVFGLSIGLSFLVPFLPLLRVVTMILLVTTTILLWPKGKKK